MQFRNEAEAAPSDIKSDPPSPPQTRISSLVVMFLSCFHTGKDEGKFFCPINGCFLELRNYGLYIKLLFDLS